MNKELHAKITYIKGEAPIAYSQSLAHDKPFISNPAQASWNTGQMYSPPTTRKTGQNGETRLASTNQRDPVGLPDTGKT